MSSLSRELVFLILQFLDEEKFKETVHKLEQESGFYFNMKYVEDEVHNGNWDEVEKYLSGFTKVDDNRYSMKIFFQIRKQKYLEALDRHDRPKAVEILVKDLKVFSTFNEELFKEITQLLTLENFRENEQLSKYGDTKSARSIMLVELKKLIEANPLFRDKLQFPTLRNSRLRTLINQSLNWQHQLCKNPRPNPDIKTLFVDHSCRLPNDARAPSPVNNPLLGGLPKAGGIPPLGTHGPFQPTPSPVPTPLAGWMSSPSSVPHPAVSGGAIALGAPSIQALKHLGTPPSNSGVEYPSGDSDHVSNRTRPMGISDESQAQVQRIYQQSLLEQLHLQFQLLQIIQQQQQFLSPGSSIMQSQLLHQQLQSQQMQPLPPLSQSQQFPSSCTNNGLSTLQPPQMLVNRPQDKQNQPVGGMARAYSGITDGGDAPSSSTSPSTNNCQISSSGFLNRSQSGPAILIPDAATDNLVHELYNKSDTRLKPDLVSQQKSKATLTDHQLEASASGTSYGLDGNENNNRQQNFLAPTFGLDGDSRNSLLGGANVDNSFVPDTLLSRGYGSQKDLQNMLSNYGGVTNDIGTEMSTSAVRTQSFGIPNVPTISNDVAVNYAGVLGGGLWAAQTQRMRTSTKVQKRGSMGRSINVNRYRGYDELRHDLARMFGIEGQFEDPHTSDWKLVYIDHENDILLVGEDPWEEFVNCVQSIKILSSAEVQQMSLDGNFADLPVTNQACSSGDSGNAWRGHYDDNSATSFNR